MFLSFLERARRSQRRCHVSRAMQSSCCMKICSSTLSPNLSWHTQATLEVQLLLRTIRLELLKGNLDRGTSHQAETTSAFLPCTGPDTEALGPPLNSARDTEETSTSAQPTLRFQTIALTATRTESFVPHSDRRSRSEHTLPCVNEKRKQHPGARLQSHVMKQHL